ncbi:MAG TPA: hypothetical protein VIF14_09455 [Alphaproteobacteria bacterium]|jgi:hypothetical protein
MRQRVLRFLALGSLALAAAAAPAAAQEEGWKTFTRPALGLTVQRPADLYELDPEAPAEDVTGEVEWGPKDHGWSVIVTSQKLKPGQTLASVVAEEKQRNPKAEAAQVKIGDGIEAARLWALDDDTLSTFVLLVDKTGTKLIAIELAIALTEDDADKSIESLRISYNGTLALFERMLRTVRIAKN